MARALRLAAFSLAACASCSSSEATLAVDPRDIPPGVTRISALLFQGSALIQATGLRARAEGAPFTVDVAAETLDRATDVRFLGLSDASISPLLLPSPEVLEDTPLMPAEDDELALPQDVWSAHGALSIDDFTLLSIETAPPRMTAPWLPQCRLAFGPAALRIKCPGDLECSSPFPSVRDLQPDIEDGCLRFEADPTLWERESALLANCARVEKSAELVFPPDGSVTDADEVPVMVATTGSVEGVRINGTAAFTEDCGDSWRGRADLGTEHNVLSIDTGFAQLTGEVRRRQWLTAPQCVAVDSDGRGVVADYSGVRTVDLDNGELSLIYKRPISNPAEFHPAGMAIDPQTQDVFVHLPAFGVYRVRRNGEEPTKVLSAPPEISFAGPIAVDSLRSKLLVVGLATDQLSPSLYEADLDGTGWRPIVPAVGCHDCIAWWGVAVDPTDPSDRALLIDRIGRLSEVDLRTGATTATIDCSGQGPYSPYELAFDRAAQRAYFADTWNLGIIEVDLLAGTCTPVSGTGPVPIVPRGLALDRARRRAVVTDVVNNALFVVDLATGARSVHGGLSRGGGPPFDGPSGSAIDPPRHRVFVSDLGARVILEVDLSSGDRRVVISEVEPRYLDYDPVHDRLIAGEIASLYAVDVATGARRVLTTEIVDPRGLAVRSDGNRAFIAEGNRISILDLETGALRELTGRGPPIVGAHTLALNERFGKLIAGIEEMELLIDVETGDRELWTSRPFVALAANRFGELVVSMTIDGRGEAQRLDERGTTAHNFPRTDIAVSGPRYDDIGSIALGNEYTVYVVSGVLHAVFAVDVRDGNSVLVSR